MINVPVMLQIVSQLNNRFFNEQINDFFMIELSSCLALCYKKLFNLIITNYKSV